MKNVIIPLVALGSVLCVTAASAQDWDRDGGWDRGGWGRHDNGWHRGWRHRHWDEGDGGCRWITIRSEDDWGNVRVRRVRRCD